MIKSSDSMIANLLPYFLSVSERQHRFEELLRAFKNPAEQVISVSSSDPARKSGRSPVPDLNCADIT